MIPTSMNNTRMIQLPYNEQYNWYAKQDSTKKGLRDPIAVANTSYKLNWSKQANNQMLHQGYSWDAIYVKY